MFRHSLESKTCFVFLRVQCTPNKAILLLAVDRQHRARVGNTAIKRLFTISIGTQFSPWNTKKSTSNSNKVGSGQESQLYKWHLSFRYKTWAKNWNTNSRLHLHLFNVGFISICSSCYFFRSWLLISLYKMLCEWHELAYRIQWTKSIQKPIHKILRKAREYKRQQQHQHQSLTTFLHQS